MRVPHSRVAEQIHVQVRFRISFFSLLDCCTSKLSFLLQLTVSGQIGENAAKSVGLELETEQLKSMPNMEENLVKVSQKRVLRTCADVQEITVLSTSPVRLNA